MYEASCYSSENENLFYEKLHFSIKGGGGGGGG